MDAEALKKHLSGKLTVPSLPSVVTEITSLMSDAGVGLNEIGACVAKDPPLTAKLLRIANSALYGVQNPILSPEHAAAVLGVDALRNLLLRVSVADLFAHLDSHPEFNLVSLWEHSILTARVAGNLPGKKWEKAISRDDAYLCGLLHNIGVFVMLDQIGEKYIAVLEKRKSSGHSLRSIELKVFGFSHDQVGHLICRKWNLPEVVLRAIRYHLDNAGAVETDEAVAVVHTANWIAKSIQADAPERAADRVRKPIADLLGLSAKEIAEYAVKSGEFEEKLSA